MWPYAKATSFDRVRSGQVWGHTPEQLVLFGHTPEQHYYYYIFLTIFFSKFLYRHRHFYQLWSTENEFKVLYFLCPLSSSKRIRYEWDLMLFAFL